jgi:hypothetical protein
MSSMHRARGALHEGTPAAAPAVLGWEVPTFDPPASGQSIRPLRLEMPEMLTGAEEVLVRHRAVYRWPTAHGSWFCIPPDPIGHSRVQHVLPPLLVLAVVLVHLAASGKQSTAVQTLKAMVRVPQVRL